MQFLCGLYSETLVSASEARGSRCFHGWAEPQTFSVGPHGRVPRGLWVTLVGLGLVARF
jgi:hypothetical protein